MLYLAKNGLAARSARCPPQFLSEAWWRDIVEAVCLRMGICTIENGKMSRGL
jgi:hypothetical protein